MKRTSSFLAVLLVMALGAGCAEHENRESTGQYLDDSAITAKVKSALLNDPDVSGSRINVETYKGTVQLSGFADNERERTQAIAIARQVQGVQSVKNDVRIKAE